MRTRRPSPGSAAQHEGVNPRPFKCGSSADGVPPALCVHGVEHWGIDAIVRRFIVIATLALLVVAPGSAVASRIVYPCNADLCAVSPDGGHRKRLTHDGKRLPYSAYREPSLSRDGRWIAYVRGYVPARNTAWVADGRLRHRRRVSRNTGLQAHEPRMRQDGRAALWLAGNDAGALSVCWTPVRRRAAPRCGSRAEPSAGWGPGGRFLLPGAVTGLGFLGLTRHLDGTGPAVLTGIPAGLTLDNYVLSPNKRLLAVTESPDTTGEHRIAIYDVRTGRRVRAVTARHADHRPAWSPDGRWIAFWRDPQDPGDGIGTVGMTASIMRVPAHGGRARTVVARHTDTGPPTWGR
jgi:hypothetical protein